MLIIGFIYVNGHLENFLGNPYTGRRHHVTSKLFQQQSTRMLLNELRYVDANGRPKQTFN